jgi:hypothetical protein
MKLLIFIFSLFCLQIHTQTKFEIQSVKRIAVLDETENGIQWSHSQTAKFKINQDLNFQDEIPFTYFQNNPIFNIIKEVKILVNGEDETDEFLKEVVKETSLGKSYNYYYLDESNLKKNDKLEIHSSEISKENNNNLHTFFVQNYYYPIKSIELIVKVDKSLENQFSYKLFNLEIEAKESDDDKYKIYTFKIEDMQPFISETYSGGFSKRAAKIEYRYSYRSWLEAYEKNSYFDNFISCINDTSGLQKIINDLNIKQLDNDSLFLESVYKKVQQVYQYAYVDLHQDGYIPHDLKHIYLMKKADCKDYTKLMINIFRHFGYKAFMIDIMTNYKASEFDPKLYYLYQFNHALLYVEDNNKKQYYLDGTGEYFTIKDIRHDVQNMPALIIDDLNKEIKNIKIPAFKFSDNKTVYSFTGELDKNFILTGELLIKYYNTNSQRIRNMVTEKDNKELREYYLKLLSTNEYELKIKEINVLTKTVFSNQFQIKISLEIANFAERLNNKLAIRTHLFKTHSYSELKQRSRLYDFFFSFPVNMTKYTYKIINNTNKIIEFHPESLSLTNDLLFYKSNFDANSDIIRYEFEIGRKLNNYPKSKKNELRKFVKKMESNYNNYIILK